MAAANLSDINIVRYLIDKGADRGPAEITTLNGRVAVWFIRHQKRFGTFALVRLRAARNAADPRAAQANPAGAGGGSDCRCCPSD